MSNKQKEIKLHGISTSPGIIMGTVAIYRDLEINISQMSIDESDVEFHKFEFRKAIKITKKNLDKNYLSTANKYGYDYAGIFKGQIALLEDEYFLKEVEEEINSNLINSEAATFKVFSSKKEYFLKLDNEYFKDRAFDIQDLKRQIIYNIRGEKKNYSLLSPSIIVAKEITPSDTIGFKRELLLGVITEFGGKTSHSSILARSLNIPSVSGIKNVASLVEVNSIVILDGVHGKVIINPSEETISTYKKDKRKFEHFIQQIQTYGKAKSLLSDGTKIYLAANIEFINELDYLKELGIKSIGLYRTEGYFLAHQVIPNEETQLSELSKISQSMPESEIIVRTLDLGGDKIHSKYDNYFEDNPFLGWRAIRLCLDEILLFKTQLRAILRASVNKNIKLMLPMVTDMSEIWEAKSIIEEIKKDLREKQIEFNENIEIGMMIETPGSAVLLERFAKEIDFISIGTNDLIQYILAVDRGNEKVSYLYQSLHPAVVNMLKTIIETANKHKLPVAMCGEMASDPMSFPILLAIGLRNFSMTPVKSLTLKRMMKELTLKECKSLLKSVEAFSSYIEVNRFIESWFSNKFPDLVL